MTNTQPEERPNLYKVGDRVEFAGKGHGTVIKVAGPGGLVRFDNFGQEISFAFMTYLAPSDVSTPPKKRKAANQNGPVDLWENRASPALPHALLPDAISSFADTMADTMGVDAGGLAMAALTVCAAVIPDDVKIQPKQYDPSWTESARIWAAAIGLPSTKKSPLIAAATRPLKRIDRDMYEAFARAKAIYDALSKDEKAANPAPRHERLRLEDTTVEAAQEVLKDSPNGLLLVQDELSGWFGAMDKYGGGGRGAQKDRAFWLQSFNGGSYTVNRVGRGASFIPNLSVCLLGGIQPELIRSIARDTHDDGLLQRLFPIVLQPAKMGKDVPMPDVVNEYDALIWKCHQLRKPLRGGMLAADTTLHIAPAAVRTYRALVPGGTDLAGAPARIDRTAGDALDVWADIAVNGDGDLLRRDRIEIVSNWPEIAIHSGDTVSRFVAPGTLASHWQAGGHRRSTTISGAALVDCLRQLFPNGEK